MAERTLHTTTSLCRVCKEAVDAQVVADEAGAVWMRKSCAAHGAQEVRLGTNAGWYEQQRGFTPADNRPTSLAVRPVDRGCPFDCGPCTQHAQKTRMPVVTITSACNLECPICYVHNNNDAPYHMGVEELDAILDHLVADRVEGRGESLDLINLTGGDPTMHPRLPELVEACHRRGIHRVSVCTNGLRLLKDEALTARLAALGTRIALSFQSFEAEADERMQGARLVETKLRVLDLLEAHAIDTTLIPVVTRGLNDHELGKMVELTFARPNIRHAEIHTMTYTGQGGVSFDRAGRISLFEVLERIEAQTEGLFRVEHFVPSPCASGLCYQVAYALVDPGGGPPIPFLEFLTAEEMIDCLDEHLYLEPSPKLERTVSSAIDRLFARDAPGDERILSALKRLLLHLFPARPLPRDEALRRSERAVKALYVHSHMDEETFDVERLAQCCDDNCYADGTTIPVCAYNVLYRETEARFVRPPRPWSTREGGNKRALPVLPA